MRLRAIIIGVVLAAVTAGPAFASHTSSDRLPDLPGMGVTGRTSTTNGDARSRTGTTRGPRTLPRVADPAATRSVPNANPQVDPAQDPAAPVFASPLPKPADDVKAAAAKPATTSRDALPRTGAAVGGFAMLGIALVAGGKLLGEFVRPFSQ